MCESRLVSLGWYVYSVETCNCHLLMVTGADALKFIFVICASPPTLAQPRKGRSAGSLAYLASAFLPFRTCQQG